MATRAAIPGTVSLITQLRWSVQATAPPVFRISNSGAWLGPRTSAFDSKDSPTSLNPNCPSSGRMPRCLAVRDKGSAISWNAGRLLPRSAGSRQTRPSQAEFRPNSGRILPNLDRHLPHLDEFRPHSLRSGANSTCIDLFSLGSPKFGPISVDVWP